MEFAAILGAKPKMNVIVIILATIGGLAVLAISLCYIYDLITDLIHNIGSNKYKMAKEMYQQTLNSDARWFSEHTPTYNLLARMSKNRTSLTNIRHFWREEMKQLEKGEKVEIYSPEN